MNIMSLANVIKDAGIPGLIVLVLGFITVFIIVERYKKLNFDSKEDGGDFINTIKNYLLKDEIGKAVTFCDANKSIPAAKVVKAILERSNRDEASMTNAAGLAIGHVEADLSKRMDYLPAMANISTLVGLFGTITGLMMSFASLGDSDAANKQEVLSAGISLAMSATAMGLGVAIPGLIAFAYLNTRMNKLMDQSDLYAAETLDLIKSRFFKS